MRKGLLDLRQRLPFFDERTWDLIGAEQSGRATHIADATDQRQAAGIHEAPGGELILAFRFCYFVELGLADLLSMQYLLFPFHP